MTPRFFYEEIRLRYDIILYYILRRCVCQSNLPCRCTIFGQYRDARSPCQLCCLHKCACSDEVVSFARRPACKNGTFCDRRRDVLSFCVAVCFCGQLIERYHAVITSRTYGDGDAFCLPQTLGQPMKCGLASADEREESYALCQIGGDCPTDHAVGSAQSDARSCAVHLTYDLFKAKRCAEETAVRERIAKRAPDFSSYIIIADDRTDDAALLCFLQARDGFLLSAYACDVVMRLDLPLCTAEQDISASYR